MKTVYLLIFILLCFVFQISAQCGLDKSQWSLIYSEEFNEPNVNTLLSQGKWNIGISPGQGIGDGNQCFSANQISLSNGYGYFNTQKVPPFLCGNNIANYQCGIISSKYTEFPYTPASPGDNGFVWGMFEIRCKLPSTINSYPCFWLDGSNTWPPEIDAFEFNAGYFNNKQFFSSVHYNNPNQPSNPLGCSNYYRYSFDLTTDFHTYTIVWTPSKITWFFDGKELKTDNIFSHQPMSGQLSNSYSEFFRYAKMHMIVSNGLNSPSTNDPAYAPFIVDYVRVYKPNGWIPIGLNQDPHQYYNQQVSLYNSVPYKSTSDWVISQIKSIEPYSTSSLMKGCQGGGKYYYKGSDGKLWSTYYIPNNGGEFHSFPINTNNTSNIKALSLSKNGDIIFFSSTMAIFLSKISYNQNNIIYNVNANITDAPFLSYFVSSNSGLIVYYINNNGKIIRYSRPSLTSHTWTKYESSFYASSDSKIILSPSNENIIYYKSSSNYLAKLNFITNVSTKLTPSGNVASNIAVSPSENQIFYKDNQGILRLQQKVVLNFVNGGHVYEWINSTIQIKNNDNTYSYVTNIKDGLCTSLNPTGVVQLYYQGTDNRPWYVYWNGSDYIANSFDWNQPNVDGDFENIILGVSNYATNIAYRDIYGQIRLIGWRTPCEMLNPPCDALTTMRAKISENDSTNNNTFITEENILIYPNPALNSLTIKCINVVIKEYWIVNTSGKIIIEGKVEDSLIDKEMTLNISDLSTGFYIIKVKLNDGRSFNYKFNKL